MFLGVDIGNTNIVLGVFDDGKLVVSSRVFTKKDAMTDEYAVLFKDILALNGIEADAIDGCVLSSVVPKLTSCISDAVMKISGCRPTVVAAGLKTGINIMIDNPSQLGSDMVANSAAAAAKYPLPAIIVDLGTAITFSVLSADRTFIGGLITAGVRTALDGLTTKTSQLQDISIEAPSSVIGTNTINCMKAGAVFGTAAMIDGVVERISAEKGCGFTVIATGGMSRHIVPYCKTKIIVEPDLMLWGLLEIYKKNA